jgi:hypothetical protein
MKRLVRTAQDGDPLYKISLIIQQARRKQVSPLIPPIEFSQEQRYAALPAAIKHDSQRVCQHIRFRMETDQSCLRLK